MSPTARQSEIVSLVRRHGFQSIEVLAGHFRVTPQTIRRDVNLLCEARILLRRHGGAELLEPLNLPYDTRRVTHLEAKRRIAWALRALVHDRASLFFGIGTTPEQVAYALADREDLTIVTNNLNVAIAFAGNATHRIVISGGTLRLPDRDILGPETEALFAAYRADLGICGVGGIDEDGTLLDFDRAEVRAREALCANCRTAILVVDASKFGRSAPARGGHLSDVDMLVVDAAPPEPFATRIQEAGIDLRVAEAEEVPLHDGF